MLDDTKKYKKLSRRSVILGGIKFTVFAAIMGRYYYLQRIKAGKFQMLSDRNRIKVLPIIASRGNILDKNGIILVDNEPLYALVMERKYLYDTSTILDKVRGTIDAGKINIQKIRNTIAKSSFKLPILLCEELSWHEIVKLETSTDTPGIDIMPWFRRRYKHPELFAHITGYIAKETNHQYSLHNEYIGKSGSEKFFDLQLKGKNGVKEIEANALGRYVRNISEKPGIQGSDLHLSIDIKLQEIVAKQLHKKSGAVVLMDASSGRLLAMHSSPTYNPNYFVKGITPAQWNAIIQDSTYPLINKSISATYAPGSVFKIITALAYLEQGYSPYDRIRCSGSHTVSGHKFHCWNKSGHGSLNLFEAIAKSCNTFFYRIAERTGIKAINTVAGAMGLGQKTGVELPFETSGLIPTPTWKRTRLSSPWFVGDTINTGIGQGYVLTTPIQLATIILKLINKSNISPTILRDRVNIDNLPFAINSANLDLVIKALIGVFNHKTGLGYNKVLRSDKLAGKTGTGQVVKSSHSKIIPANAFFVGFAPYDNPKFIVSVILERAGWAGKTALPLALNILREAQRIY